MLVPETTFETQSENLLSARAVGHKKSFHRLHLGDARDLSWIPDESVHLVVTSPPYWTLKEYNVHEAQLGAIVEYDAFMNELDKVWAHCFRALVPGGRL